MQPFGFSFGPFGEAVLTVTLIVLGVLNAAAVGYALWMWLGWYAPLPVLGAAALWIFLRFEERRHHQPWKRPS